MENAIKALYIAAGTLIGVMVLTALVYLFRTGASLGENYQYSQETLQLEAFNAQFDKYQKGTQQSNQKSEGYIFYEKGNTASEVISCANLAFSINKKNEYDNRNHVQVIVVLNEGGVKKRLYVHPLENQRKNNFVTKDFNSARANINESDYYDFYDFLNKYNEVRIVNIKNSSGKTVSSHESIYKYYFDVINDENGAQGNAIGYSNITGKVNKIVFTMNETENFGSSNTCWQDI